MKAAQTASLKGGDTIEREKFVRTNQLQTAPLDRDRATSPQSVAAADPLRSFTSIISPMYSPEAIQTLADCRQTLTSQGLPNTTTTVRSFF